MSKISKLVQIQLDKPRNLLLNMNSMIEFENVTGIDFLEFSRRIQRRTVAYSCKQAILDGKTDVPAPIEADLLLPDLSIKELRAMLWSLLIHEDDKLTLQQVGNLITLDNMQDICQAMTKAQQVNAPETEKTEQSTESPAPLAVAPQA